MQPRALREVIACVLDIEAMLDIGVVPDMEGMLDIEDMLDMLDIGTMLGIEVELDIGAMLDIDEVEVVETEPSVVDVCIIAISADVLDSLISILLFIPVILIEEAAMDI